MRYPSMQSQSAFTLVELVMVIVVLSIISVFAVMKSTSLASLTLSSQSQQLASDIRHAQTLANTWGKSLTLTISAGTNGSYSVSCSTNGTSPCDVSPVIDPATGNSFNRQIQKDVVLSGTASLVFDSTGQPGSSASYTLSDGSHPDYICVASVTGFVTVQSVVCS